MSSIECQTADEVACDRVAADAAEREEAVAIRHQLEQVMDAASDGIRQHGSGGFAMASSSVAGPSCGAYDMVMVKVDATGRSSVHRGPTDELDRPQRPRATHLTKEELLAKYANDSTWIRLRWGLLALITVAWLAMLGVAAAIIVWTPKCAPKPHVEWWQSAVVYDVDTRSFQDTDGDGVGDLKGIQERLNYISNLGVSAVHLNSIYMSSGTNSGVMDHMNIDPRFGTMEDMRHLIDAMHKKGLKLVMDFIPNQTGLKHAWFNASRHSATHDTSSDSIPSSEANNTFRDFYVWHQGKLSDNGITRLPPNNWRCADGGSAWEYDNVRREFYYHAFSKDEPDLNLRNAAVLEHLDKILRFWLNYGVDGFYVKSAANLVESQDVLDESPDGLSQTKFQPESYALMTRWRDLVDRHSQSDGKPRSQSYSRLLIAEADGPVNQTVAYSSQILPDVRRQQPHMGAKSVRAHLAINLALTNLDQDCRAPCILTQVKEWMDGALAAGVWSNWQLGNNAKSRIASRMADQHYTNSVNMLLLTLPGTAFSYYGDEIGMHDVATVEGGTGQMSPMQWSGRHMAGFTTANTSWLPLADDYRIRNVETQLAHGAGVTHIEVYQLIAGLRRQPSFEWGDFYPGADDDVFYFVRQASGFPGFLVAVNLGPLSAAVDFVGGKSTAGLVPDVATVAATTANFAAASAAFGREDEYQVDATVTMTNVYLRPGEGVVFRWEQDVSSRKTASATM